MKILANFRQAAIPPQLPDPSSGSIIKDPSPNSVLSHDRLSGNPPHLYCPLQRAEHRLRLRPEWINENLGTGKGQHRTCLLYTSIVPEFVIVPESSTSWPLGTLKFPELVTPISSTSL